MGRSCAVQGVIKLKSHYIAEFLNLYKDKYTGSHFDLDDVRYYLFGINISQNIQSHFSEKAADKSFDHADFDTGFLTFVSGFSSHELDAFIGNIQEISDHYIVYCAYENNIKFDNEYVFIKNLGELKQYLPKFNDSNFIESSIPFENFDQDGSYQYTEKFTDTNSSFGHYWEEAWVYQGNN